MNYLGRVVYLSISLFLLILTIFILHSSFYAPYRIASGSMEPTMLIGDVVLTREATFGLKWPTLSKGNYFPQYIFSKKRDPQRGDIVTFPSPDNDGNIYVKRLVGVPGDSLEIRDNVLYINGEATKHEEIDHPPVYLDEFEQFNLKFFASKIGNKEFVYMINQDNPLLHNMKEVVLGPDEYFAMGDNRDFSRDSRFFGPIPRDRIIAKVDFVIFSMQANSLKLGVFRPSRFMRYMY